jgi:LysR family transcriptional regulator, chromosome initiation inhibitor
MALLSLRIGQVFLVRETPCTPASAGIPLLRVAAQTTWLAAEVRAGDGSAARIAVAVNADSRSRRGFTLCFAALAPTPHLRMGTTDH